MDKQLVKRRGNLDIARIKIKSKSTVRPHSANEQTNDDNLQQHTYRSQTLLTGSSDAPLYSIDKNSSRFPLNILKEHDY